MTIIKTVLFILLALVIMFFLTYPMVKIGDREMPKPKTTDNKNHNK